MNDYLYKNISNYEIQKLYLYFLEQEFFFFLISFFYYIMKIRIELFNINRMKKDPISSNKILKTSQKRNAKEKRKDK